MMIQCQNIQKYYGAELVLSDISFEIKKGEKVGLIGRNGTGKTTLMRLLMGSESPDQGLLAISKDARIGALAQIPNYSDQATVYSVLQSAFKNLLDAKDQMQQLEAEMSAGSTSSGELLLESMLKQYGRLQEVFERGGGYEIESTIERVTSGLSIPSSQYERPFSSLSGGEKTKVGLAVILLQNPDILLLDEPTNHLDMAAIQWLESFLHQFEGTVVVISHDRYFLDTVAGKIIEIEDGEAFTYYCNYSSYKVEKEQKLLLQFADYQEQQKKIKKMQDTIKQLIDWGNRSNPPNPGFHRRAASMQKALDRMVKLKRPILERRAIDLQLQQSDRSGKDALVLADVGKSISERRLYSDVNVKLRYGEMAVLIGANGTGKTTLLKSIIGMDSPDEGEIKLGSRVEFGYLAQESAPSDHEETVLQYFRKEIGMETGEARNQLARFLFYGADVFKKVRSLSGGEWTRLRLAILMHQQPNLLLFDEPTNHLDIDSREALEEALEDYPGSLLAISHDRYFINKIAGQIWSLENGQMNVYLGNYDSYQAELVKKHYVSTPSTNDTVKIIKDNSRNISSKQINPASLEKLERDIGEVELSIATIDVTMTQPEVVFDAQQLSLLQAQRDEAQQVLDELTEKYFQMLENDVTL
ncbi:ribosomal protection-like ABC-F family protein [Paenibacillus segetis]|uniref:ABC transporter ATP-binding protein n=1 Tax=Paenibacillus segetis TaxID=1325360 RepID=A0ABQ1YP53_9BACL|nr:ABC-F family ATP-binding cassette domain-containing protein [Paenibacillus segetis]GGH32397.1 ABC transporter ATP-binding protein [Paenibacillus segetis]